MHDPRHNRFLTPSGTVISPETTLRAAGELLARNQLRFLPVVDDGRLVNIVSTPDLLALLDDVRHAADLYLRSGEGAHEHAALVRALEQAREALGPALATGRL